MGVAGNADDVLMTMRGASRRTADVLLVLTLAVAVTFRSSVAAWVLTVLGGASVALCLAGPVLGPVTA